MPRKRRLGSMTALLVMAGALAAGFALDHLLNRRLTDPARTAALLDSLEPARPAESAALPASPSPQAAVGSLERPISPLSRPAAAAPADGRAKQTATKSEPTHVATSPRVNNKGEQRSAPMVDQSRNAKGDGRAATKGEPGAAASGEQAAAPKVEQRPPAAAFAQPPQKSAVLTPAKDYKALRDYALSR